MELKTEEFDRFLAQAERFRLLAKANNIALVEWQATKGLRISQEFIDLTGWTAEQLPNYEDAASRADVRYGVEDWMETVHPDDRAAAREAALDYFLFRKGASYKSRYRLLCANGTYITVDVSAIALWEKGKIVGVDLTVRPVTPLQIKVDAAEVSAKKAEAVAEQNEKLIGSMRFWANRLIPALAGVALATVTALTGLFFSVRENINKITNNQKTLSTLAESTGNIRLTEPIDEVKVLNQRAFEISQLLQNRGDAAALIFVGAYYPEGAPQTAQIFAQFRKNTGTSWLSTEPEEVRNTNSQSYARTVQHFSTTNEAIFERRLTKDGETVVEYSLAGRLPSGVGGQPFFVGAQVPGNATPAATAAAKEAVRSLKADMDRLLEPTL